MTVNQPNPYLNQGQTVAAQQYTQYITPSSPNWTVGSLGSGGAGSFNSGQFGQQVYYPQSQNNAYPVLPMASGIMTTIAWSDAAGHNYTLVVDQAYVQVFYQIQMMQSQIYNQHVTVKHNATPMIENDFSMDELEQAEKILEEMDYAGANA